jgi:hypothetical protein
MFSFEAATVTVAAVVDLASVQRLCSASLLQLELNFFFFFVPSFAAA